MLFLPFRPRLCPSTHALCLVYSLSQLSFSPSLSPSINRAPMSAANTDSPAASTVARHHLARAALIDTEHQRSHHYRSTTTAKQQHAIDIVARLRREECQNLWNQEKDGVYHAMPFTSSKAVIQQQSKLFTLLQKVRSSLLYKRIKLTGSGLGTIRCPRVRYCTVTLMPCRCPRW